MAVFQAIVGDFNTFFWDMVAVFVLTAALYFVVQPIFTDEEENDK